MSTLPCNIRTTLEWWTLANNLLGGLPFYPPFLAVVLSTDALL